MSSEIDTILKFNMIQELCEEKGFHLYQPEVEDEMFKLENYDNGEIHEFHSLAGVEKHLSSNDT